MAGSTGDETQTMSQCTQCGYMTSAAVCKACGLLAGLNRARAKTALLPQ